MVITLGVFYSMCGVQLRFMYIFLAETSGCRLGVALISPKILQWSSTAVDCTGSSDHAVKCCGSMAGISLEADRVFLCVIQYLCYIWYK